MTFKINISQNSKTYNLESEAEILIGKKIGESFKGEIISPELKGYELKITGTSDLSGIPGKKNLDGQGYHRELLTYGFGMKSRIKGLRKRKTLRGEEISLKTIQINTQVLKEGGKKFSELALKKSSSEEKK